ncbi:hypothetical protein [Haliangium sp.]|uniref:hypothetical protein n=1 Tax=Haliangium sp. TaxID=2663208 RepID=UPI003D134C20
MHAIPIRYASVKARRGPYALAPDDTLDVVIDGRRHVVRFEQLDVARRAQGTQSAVACVDVAGKQMVEIGAAMSVDGDALRISSGTAGYGRSLVRVIGGSAQAKLGFDGHVHRPLCIGAARGRGAAKRIAPDTIALPACPECGSCESLVRTWDQCPAAYARSFLAQHRRAVNALATHLEATGFALSPSSPRGLSVRAGAAPPDIDPRYPEKRLVLSVPQPIQAAR